MAEGKRILVRHGRYLDTGGLNAAGKEQARRAADKVARLTGSAALILSSTLPRAAETADSIQQKIHAQVIGSRLISIGGNYPEAIRDLNDFLVRAAALEKVELPPDRDVVVVTHGPLIAMALGYDVDDVDQRIDYGGVYVPHTPWHNPDYTETYAHRILDSTGFFDTA